MKIQKVMLMFVLCLFLAVPVIAQPNFDSIQFSQQSQQKQAFLATGFIIAFLIVFAISLVPAIFYILTLQKALNKCNPENRDMSPGLIWLYLIPLFNLFWHFMIVFKMASSLEKEFKSRQIETDPMPGKTLGLVMCILFACSIIPGIGGLISLGGLVCWIIYWVKIAGYSKQLDPAQN